MKFYDHDDPAVTGTFGERGHCVARPASGIWWRWQVTISDKSANVVQRRDGWAEGPEDAKVQMMAAITELTA